MKYKQIDPTYKDDVIAEALHSREHEHFHYELDRQNFEFMLTTLPEGAQREYVKERLRTTLEQMSIVENAHAALTAQITDQAAHQAAIIRTKLKRDAEKSLKI